MSETKLCPNCKEPMKPYPTANGGIIYRCKKCNIQIDSQGVIIKKP